MDDREMVQVAKDRGIVRLYPSNKVVTLVSWGSTRKRTGLRGDNIRQQAGRGSTARVESPDGERRWTIKKQDIIEVVVPSTKEYQDG